MIEIKKYTADQIELWNNFVDSSRNGTFLLNRGFMDYHSDRFNDHSLLVFREKKLIAIFPANEKDRSIVSHEGLTYGGLLASIELLVQQTIEVFYYLLKYYADNGFEELNYKQLPSFYHKNICNEDEYALFLCESKLSRIDTAFVVDQSCDPVFQKRRIRSLKKAQKEEVKIKEVDDFSEYWSKVLCPNLMARFGVHPVHSLAEIELLADRFPDGIKQFNSYLSGEIVAGTTIFLGNNVAHSQYISSMDIGRKSGALDLLFHWLIKERFKTEKYFSFGIANENEGKTINKGLSDWKEGLGGRAWAHRFYTIKTKNYLKLENYVR